MVPRRRNDGYEPTADRHSELEPDDRGPWTLVDTNGLFSHTLLTGLTRAEAEQLLEDVLCDRCECAVSGVPPWESEVVISQYVCRHCRCASAEGETARNDKRVGTEFLLIQEGADVDVL